MGNEAEQYNAASWLVDRHVDAGRGERVALRYGGASITYAQLLTAVGERQHVLHALGIRPGDRVAMVVRDEPGFVAWFLGALRGGVVPVPLSTMLTAGELAAIVADAGACAVVVSAAYAGHLAAIADAAPLLEVALVLPHHDRAPVTLDPMRLRLVTTGDVLDPPRWAEPPDVADTTGASPAFWLYSSGTTGLPKGVMHRHASLQATADTYGAAVLGIGPDDRTLSVAKLFFAFGLGNSLTFPLAVGASAVLNPDPPTPAGITALLVAERPTLFFSSPGFVAALLDAGVPPDTFASVRATVTAGEALPADLARRFSARFGHPVLDGLGTTEALHIFLSNRLDAARPGTSGLPVAGYEIELRDDEGAVVPAPDAPGYLHVRGPSIADGYWQRPQATAEAFLDGWLRTGDVYERADDGYYRFLGRNNDMIKAGGIWVSPAEVEAVLVEHPDVLEAAVVGARDDDGLETTVAFVVPRSGRTIDAATIDAHCRERMAAFKRPRRLVVVEALPKTATGKVQRFALRNRLAGDEPA
jgi:benzoate-CoA ligase family protein